MWKLSATKLESIYFTSIFKNKLFFGWDVNYFSPVESVPYAAVYDTDNYTFNLVN